jgi:hypothetical protein
MLGLHRDEVFTAGGQPTVTYVDRKAEDVERTFARAIATPTHIVSLSGPTKTGKTVLCRKMLGDREYVWVDGGQVSSDAAFWDRVCHELSLPYEQENSVTKEQELQLEIGPLFVTAAGSRLRSSTSIERTRIDSMAAALSLLTREKIFLVIDDFHYLDDTARTAIMRNVKGAVFNGLKAILLSVTHRVFDAIKAESELTGRFTAISLPHWSEADLRRIPIQGFDALGVDCSESMLDILCAEAQESPFLMQKFCWEICFDREIEKPKILGRHKIPEEYDLSIMFKRISLDAGLPIYQKLAAGPQSRKARAKRPLRSGGEADIYESTLVALARTGPKPVVSYDELRAALGQTLSDQVPQKHEITSALKHLAKIARTAGMGSTIDWDDDAREVNVVDPYLRFYLRWQIRKLGGGG